MQEVKSIDFVNETIDFGDGDIFFINGKEGAYDSINLHPCTGFTDTDKNLIFENDTITIGNDDYVVRCYNNGYSIFNTRTLQCSRLTSEKAEQSKII